MNKTSSSSKELMYLNFLDKIRNFLHNLNFVKTQWLFMSYEFVFSSLTKLLTEELHYTGSNASTL